MRSNAGQLGSIRSIPPPLKAPDVEIHNDSINIRKQQMTGLDKKELQAPIELTNMQVPATHPSISTL